MYLLQTREAEQAAPNSFRPKGQLRWTPWRTIRKEPNDEWGGAAAETWLLAPIRGLTEKRLKIGGKGGYILTREACRAAHADEVKPSLPPTV